MSVDCESVSIRFLPVRYKLYTQNSTLFTLHSTLFTLHSTQYTLHFTIYALHSSLYTLYNSTFLRGMRPVEAMVEFLDRSQGLQDCGVDYYPTKVFLISTLYTNYLIDHIIECISVSHLLRSIHQLELWLSYHSQPFSCVQSGERL